MRILVITNTSSGGSDGGIYDFIRVIGEQTAEVVLRFTDGSTPLETLTADASGFDRVVAAGGDGTVSTICYEMRDTGVPVLVYPAGTANLLAANLALPTEPRALADVLINGAIVRFDLGEMERDAGNGTTVRTGFAVMAGAGYDASIMEAAAPLKSTIGPAAYLVAAVSNLTPTASRFELVVDGEHLSTDGIAVLLVNFARIQFDLPVTHGSDPRDGRLEVAVVRSRNVVGLLPAVAAAVLDRTGDHPDRTSSIDVYSAESVEVSANPPLRMQSDGDALDALTPFAARVLPGAATLLVPQGSPWTVPQDSPAQ